MSGRIHTNIADMFLHDSSNYIKQMTHFSSHFNPCKHACTSYLILMMICVDSLHLGFIVTYQILQFGTPNLTGNTRFVSSSGPHVSFMTYEAYFAESTQASRRRRCHKNLQNRYNKSRLLARRLSDETALQARQLSDRVDTDPSHLSS